jgi:hypothetical protein
MKLSGRLIIAAVLLMVMAGAGCSSRSEWLGASIEATQPARTSEIRAEAVEPTKTEEKSPAASSTPPAAATYSSSSAEPGVKVPPEAEKAVQLAVDDLTSVLDVGPDAVTILSVDSVEWSDTSLGCPEPDKIYAQVITPGFLIKLEAAGEEYVYHTDESRFVVLCPEGQSTQP